jgi:hypothetical protein
MEPCYKKIGGGRPGHTEISRCPCRVVWSAGLSRLEPLPSWFLTLRRVPGRGPTGPRQLLRPPPSLRPIRSPLVCDLLVSCRLLHGRGPLPRHSSPWPSCPWSPCQPQPSSRPPHRAWQGQAQADMGKARLEQYISILPWT